MPKKSTLKHRIARQPDFYIVDQNKKQCGRAWMNELGSLSMKLDTIIPPGTYYLNPIKHA